MFACPATDDFFRSRIDQMIGLRHPLAVLASRMPWQGIEARVAHLFVRKVHVGVAMSDLDHFDEKPQRNATASNAGHLRVPLRVMIALLYLKYVFNESDDGVVRRWTDTLRWQRIADQSRSRKSATGTPKLYAWHASEAECIAKGKSQTPYEFGVKVGIASALHHNLVGASWRSKASRMMGTHWPSRWRRRPCWCRTRVSSR